MPTCNRNIMYEIRPKQFYQNEQGNAVGWQNIHPRTLLRAVELQINSARTTAIVVHMQLSST